MNNANALLSRLNDLVAENQESIHTTLTNVEQVTTMLADQRKDEIVLAISDRQGRRRQSFKTCPVSSKSRSGTTWTA